MQIQNIVFEECTQKRMFSLEWSHILIIQKSEAEVIKLRSPWAKHVKLWHLS